MKNIIKISVIASAIVSATSATGAETATSNSKYHTQDVRNVSSELHIRYDDSWGDPITLGGKFGDDKSFSVGGDYVLQDGDDELKINGQFNFNENFLIGAEYAFEGERLTFGGDYAQGVSFGVFNVGADYTFYDNIDDELTITGGLLVPFAKTFYYRGDVDYGLEYEQFHFKNKVGFYNGNIDANIAYTLGDGDDVLALEFLYQF